MPQHNKHEMNLTDSVASSSIIRTNATTSYTLSNDHPTINTIQESTKERNEHATSFPPLETANSTKDILQPRIRKSNFLSRHSGTFTLSLEAVQHESKLSPFNSRRFDRSVSVVSTEKDLKHTLSTQFKHMTSLSTDEDSKSRKVSDNSMGNKIERVNTAPLEAFFVEEDEENESDKVDNLRPQIRRNSHDTPTPLGGVSLLIEADMEVMDKAIQKTIAHHSPDAAITTVKQNSVASTDSGFKEGNEFNIKKGGIQQTVLQYAGHYLHLVIATPSIVRVPNLANKYASKSGSAFFFTYVLCLLLVVAPICLVEVTMAQYSSLGPVTIYERCLPVLKGVGYGMVATSCILMLLSSTWLTWSIYYMFKSLSHDLPWMHCPSNSTPDCTDLADENQPMQINATLIPSDYFFQKTVTKCLEVHTEDALSFDITLLPIQVLVWVLLLVLVSRHEAWSHRFLSWISAGITLVVLLVLMISGLSLSNSSRGLRQVFLLQFSNLRSELAEPNLWLDSLGQAIWSMGPTIGVLIARSSFHNFHHKIARDVLISALMNLFYHVFLTILTFSFVGHLNLDDPINKNPGVFFVISSYAVTLQGAPNFGSFVLFVCVSKSLLSHSLILVETVTTSLSDSLPIFWRDGWRRFLIDLTICIFGLVFSLILVTKEGIYFMTTTDAFVPWVCGIVLGLLEVTMLAYLYKSSRIQEHFIKMQKSQTSLALVWKFFIPLVFMGLLIWTVTIGINAPISWSHEITRRENLYDAFGLVMAVLPIVITVFVLCLTLIQNRKNMQSLLRPSMHWGTALSRHRHLYLMNTTKAIDNRPWLAVQASESGKFLPDQIQTWIPWGYSWVPECSEERVRVPKEGNPNITPAFRKQLANLLKNRFSSANKGQLLNGNSYRRQSFRSSASIVKNHEDNSAVRERKSNLKLAEERSK